jgi:pimeloyl-ACP methyl ester carboxylesterase
MESAAGARLHTASFPSSGPSRGTLVLLHGLTDSCESWADAVGRWTTAGWDVVTVDARGHGHSPRWSPAELAGRPGNVMADDVADLVRGMETRVALVGHSMGATVAVAAAAQVPQLVEAVVAEDPPWGRLPVADRELGFQWLREHDEGVRTPRQVRIERRRQESPSWPETELEPWAEAKEQTDPELLRRGDIVPSTPWPELVQVLHHHGVPLLVITGDRDVLVDDGIEADARRLGAEVVRVPTAGHCVRRDCGQAYHRVVDAFLSRHESAPTA